MSKNRKKEHFFEPIPAQSDVKDTVYSTTVTFGNADIILFLDTTFLFEDDADSDEPKLIHNHSYHELVAILEGGNTFNSLDRQTRVEVGEAVFFAAGVLHLREANPQSARLSMGFNLKKNTKSAAKEDLYSIIKSAIDKFSLQKIDASLNIPYNLQRVKELLNSENLFSFYRIRVILEDTILSLITYLASMGLEDSGAKAVSPAVFQNSRTNMLYLLNQRLNNFTLDTKLEDIAKEFFISTRQLSRYIKQLYGKTYTERKKEMRIESAKRMLLQTDKPSSAIAIEIGFKDKTSFYTAFKSFTGMRPSEYRLKNNTTHI